MRQSISRLTRRPFRKTGQGVFSRGKANRFAGSRSESNMRVGNEAHRMKVRTVTG